MHSVGGGVLSVFTRTKFQSVFLLAYEIAYTRHPFLSFACACVFFSAVSMTLALWLCLHCNLCRTASNSGVKKGHVSHWLIDWLVTYSKPEVSARARLCTLLFFYIQRAFDHSRPNQIRLCPLRFAQLLLLFGTVTRHGAMLFSARKTDSDGVGPGSWPLRWATVALMSRCSPPHTPPCPSPPTLMIPEGHQPNHPTTPPAV